MKSDDKNILREVQKNTQMAMQAIDSISSKIYDDTLAAQVTKDSMRYGEIYNRATNEPGNEPWIDGYVEDNESLWECRWPFRGDR